MPKDLVEEGIRKSFLTEKNYYYSDVQEKRRIFPKKSTQTPFRGFTTVLPLMLPFLIFHFWNKILRFKRIQKNIFASFKCTLKSPAK